METRSKLRTSEAAAYLGLSRRTLYKMAEERRIPHYKVGATLWFDVVELDSWIESYRVEVE